MRFLFAMAALVPTFCCAGVPLTLKADALVSGARVTLADVVQAQAGAPALAAVDLGAAPLPGYTLRIASAQLARILRARALPYQLAAGGAPAVSVERRTQPTDQQVLAAVAEQALRRAADSDGTRIEPKPGARLPEMALPDGAVTFTARPVTVEAVRRRSATVWVEVAVDGVFYRVLPVLFALRAYRPALLAAQSLPVGATPSCETTVLGEVELTSLDSQAALDCRLLQGSLKRPLARGEPLLLAQLRVTAAVAHGDSVSLVFADGAIVVESRAIALGEGQVGQHIDVRPAGAAQVVRAQVAAPGRVTLTGK
jgi:flagella basal body P-ring formation protein FlgA